MNFSGSQPKYIEKQLRSLLSGKRNASRRSVVGDITALLAYSGDARPSQSWLSNRAGIVRENGNRVIKNVTGPILVKIYRHRKPCRYFLTSEFINLRDRFSDLIPALKKISLLMLFSISVNVLATHVTPYNNNIYTTASRWSIRQLKQPDYGFYEQRPAKKQSVLFFITNNQPQTVQQPQKERNMDNKPSLSFIASTFGLSEAQLDLLNNYSEAALQYAVKEMARQKVKPNAPAGWIASVARSFQQKASGFPKKGGLGNAGSSNSFNANHSPSIARPNAFRDDYEQASAYTEGQDYEEHLDEISQDKTDPEGYKLLVRRYDYRRIAR